MNYAENVQSLWKEARNWLDLQKQYLSLDATEKLSLLLSAIATAVVCLALGMAALFFLLIALAFWIGGVAGCHETGFLLVGILFLLMMAAVLFRRRQWIVQPLARFIAGLFLREDNEEEEVEP